MTQKVYVGVNNVAKNVSKMYVGIQESYKVLEYISFSGSQYIDTGIYPFKTKTEIKFAFNSLTASSSQYVARKL